jgi:hypothetical protein
MKIKVEKNDNTRITDVVITMARLRPSIFSALTAVIIKPVVAIGLKIICSTNHFLYSRSSPSVLK